MRSFTFWCKTLFATSLVGTGERKVFLARLTLGALRLKYVGAIYAVYETALRAILQITVATQGVNALVVVSAVRVIEPEGDLLISVFVPYRGCSLAAHN